MKFLSALLCSILFLSITEASDKSREEYLALIKQYPHLIAPMGESVKGEIEIITDPEKMAAIEKAQNRDVGVVWRDKYWIWINDACRFPKGNEGIYARILWVKALTSNPGVAVMPVLPDGRIVLNCNFRHATRTWEFELPRGIINPNETPEAAAQREALEETGMQVDYLEKLGDLPPDTGVITSIIPVFRAQVIKQQKSQQDETEAIEDIIALSRKEIKEAFAQGYYLYKIRGKEQKVFFRDPFLAYAFLLTDEKK